MLPMLPSADARATLARRVVVLFRAALVLKLDEVACIFRDCISAILFVSCISGSRYARSMKKCVNT